MIHASWRDRFERDGFLVLPGFAEGEACDELKARAEHLVAELAPADHRSIFTTRDQDRRSDEYFLTSGDKIRVFFEEDGEHVNKLGHAMHDLDPVFERFSHSPELDALGREVAGLRRPLVLQSMYIFKGPRVGGEVSLHTDHTFLWTDPPSVTGFWFAIEDATVENGCMWAVPGGHRQPARKRFKRNAAGNGTEFEVFDPGDYPTDGEVPLEAEKGTLVLLHGLLPHRSGPNTSDRRRDAYTLHAIDGAASYRGDNWLQRSPALPLRGLA